MIPLQSQFNQQTVLEVEAGASLAFWEAYMAGRLAHGEAWRFNFYKVTLSFSLAVSWSTIAPDSVQVNKFSAIHSGWGNIGLGGALMYVPNSFSTKSLVQRGKCS